MNGLWKAFAFQPRNCAACVLLACLLLVPARSASAQMNMTGHVMETRDEIPPEKLPPPQKLAGVGNVHLQITATPEAQSWFDQGLNLIHDFWDYESARAFQQGIRVDPNCAMCYWGLYRALSFYHGNSQEFADQALEKAVSLEKHVSKHERFYIDADAADVNAEKDGKETSGAPASAPIWRKLVKKYPHDLEARLCFAMAVGYDGSEGLAMLESVLKDDPNNSAANHFYIHAVEASDHPEKALHSSDILGALAPASGHMVHMPGHIYFRVGDYARAEASFAASMNVDATYMQEQHVSPDDDWNYIHNLMYAIANLLEEGKLQQAQALSEKLAAARGDTDATLYPFSARDSIARLDPQLPVALRAGDWARVIALSKSSRPPAGQVNLQLLARELNSFGSAMQAVESGDVASAIPASAEFDAELWRATQDVKDKQAAEKEASAKAKPAPAGAPQVNVRSDAYIDPLLKMLAVMSLESRGSILAARKHTAESKKIFEQAAREEKDLGYHEPPNYIRPVGETEAAALLAADDFAGAAAAYQKALIERPKSGFALYGVALVAEKSGDSAAAAETYTDFLKAWNHADPDLPQIAHARAFLSAHPVASRSGQK